MNRRPLLLSAAVLAAGGISAGAVLIPQHLSAPTAAPVSASAPETPVTAAPVGKPTSNTQPGAAAEERTAASVEEHTSKDARTDTPTGANAPASSNPGQSPAQSNSSTPRSERAPLPARTLSTHDAGTIVDAYSAAASALSGDVQPDLDDLKSTLAGAALQEVQAEQLELKATGESIRGSAVVSDVRVLQHGGTAEDRTARVSACIDSGGVQRVDAGGRPVSAVTVGSQRALNLYDLRLEDGTWRVVRHTFPADTTC